MAGPNEQVVISAVPLMGELIVPALMNIGATFPEIGVVYRSELGFANLADCSTIAIRAGAEPAGDRLAVRWLGRISVALVATQAYIARHGLPETPADLARYEMVAHDFPDGAAPWSRWLLHHTRTQRTIFRTNDETVLRLAIRSGRCAGFLPISSLIWSPELVELMPSSDEWAAPLWLVHDRGASQACRDVGRELADIVSRQLE
ncbi:hypothetical protein FQV27_04175 [Paracoccus aurantiacus]|uniref:LysR substrate-binding domain-containing protein n=1 Tax=Paracoccus aurantiacus TaxID=2599412 RepID=A0A5C6S997_9RHOB|nr:LysR substrate-binding domain-containing protein [Paracoccus aurantiacus]TXB71051.1 hypothetical protein FQV27_04175 [Paracoccus aurantiacus]